MKTNEPLYPIREVSRITGVNSITLRAWERRYGLIEPIRTESGHRLYTDAHIEEVKAAVALTQQGIPISRVKKLLSEQKSVLMQSSQSANQDIGEAFKESLESLDISAIEATLDRLFSDYPEKQAYQLLLDFSREQESSGHAQRLFWQNTVSLRLQVRLRHLVRTMPLHSCKRVLMFELSEPSCRVVQLLLQLHYASLGIYSLVENSGQEASASLVELMKSLDIETLVLQGLRKTEEESWLEWSRKYSSIEVQAWWSDTEPKGLTGLVQNEGFELKRLFI